jgi:hypothetical protein
MLPGSSSHNGKSPFRRSQDIEIVVTGGETRSVQAGNLKYLTALRLTNGGKRAPACRT